MSYQTAYMKAHYPVEFIAASMTLDLNNTDKLSEFRAEAQRLGIKVEAPSVNRSGPTFEVSDGTIYYALAALKGVGQQAVELIVEARKAGAFTSLADFAARVNPRAINKRVIESLAAAGAFDTLDSNRARVFAGAEAILAACQRSHEAATVGQNDMFGGRRDAPTIMLPQVEPWLPAERLRREYDAIGFFLSGHPLDDYATALKRLRVQSWAEFSRAVKTGAHRRQGRRHRGVADGAAYQDRQQDGHHGPVRSDRPFRGRAVFRGPRAISRRAGAGGPRCCCSWVPSCRARMSAPACCMPSRWTTPRRRPRRDFASSSATPSRSNPSLGGCRCPRPGRGAPPPRGPQARPSPGTDGRRRRRISLVMMLDLETEVEMKLPGRFKVSPQIAGAIKAVSGVVDVQTL